MKGHKADDCEFDCRVCYNCFSKDHSAKDCTKEKKEAPTKGGTKRVRRVTGLTFAQKRELEREKGPKESNGKKEKNIFPFFFSFLSFALRSEEEGKKRKEGEGEGEGEEEGERRKEEGERKRIRMKRVFGKEKG